MIAARLLAFAAALRRNGVRAGGAEVIDALRAVRDLGAEAFADKEILRAALSCTLAKSPGDEETLARVFDLHFGFGLEAQEAPPLAELLRARGLSEGDIDELLRALAAGAEGSEDAAEAALAALLAGDAARLTEVVRAALEDSDLEGLQSPLQVAYFTSRLLQRMGQGALEARLLRGRAAVRRKRAELEEGTPADRAVASVLWEVSERLRRTARRAVELELEKRTLAKPARTGSLLERDLRAVDAEELEALRALVRRLAEKLKTRLLARRRRARRGRIDPRRTLRRSVATDAIPMRVVLERRRPARPEVLILCDVSDSVRQTSLFMLELVSAVSDVLRRARSFVFVDRIGEVTALFPQAGAASGRTPDQAIERILGGEVIPVSANSDYGRALRQLWDLHGSAITRKTTVVILGDGRSNYRPPEDWVLAEIRRRARRVLWLSPEERALWGFGDSEMPRFARHADAIHVVRTAADLARAIDRIAR
jgi:uncharacterized protein